MGVETVRAKTHGARFLSRSLSIAIVAHPESIAMVLSVFSVLPPETQRPPEAKWPIWRGSANSALQKPRAVRFRNLFFRWNGWRRDSPVAAPMVRQRHP